MQVLRQLPWKDASIFIGILALVFLFPIFSALLLTLIVSMRGDRGQGWWVLMMLAFIPSVINMNKFPDGDLFEYYYYFSNFRGWGFIEFWHKYQSLISSSDSPVFHFASWILVHFGFSNPLMTFFWSMVIYCCSLRTAYLWGRNLGLRSEYLLLLICVILSVGITFSLSAHLMRQFIAGSIGLLGISEILLFKSKTGWVLLLLSPLIHISFALLFAIFIVIYSLKSYLVKPSGLSAFMIGCIMFPIICKPILGSLEVLSLGNFFKDDGSYPIAYHIVNIALILISLVGMKSLKTNNASLLVLLIFFMAYESIIFCIQDITLLYLRVSFYSDFLRGAALATCIAVLQQQRAKYLTVGLALAFMVVFFAFVDRSAWNYGGKSVDFLTRSLPQLFIVN